MKSVVLHEWQFCKESAIRFYNERWTRNQSWYLQTGKTSEGGLDFRIELTAWMVVLGHKPSFSEKIWLSSLTRIIGVGYGDWGDCFVYTHWPEVCIGGHEPAAQSERMLSRAFQLSIYSSQTVVFKVHKNSACLQLARKIYQSQIPLRRTRRHLDDKSLDPPI